MDTTGQQTLYLDFFLRPVEQKALPSKDSIPGYRDFIVDSLNPAMPDSLFRFELKEIIIPEQALDTMSGRVVYNQPSIFMPATGHRREIKPEVRANRESDWFTALFMLCVVLITWIRYFNFRRIKQLFKAVAGRHNVNQLVRDGNLVEERITPGLILVYLSGLAMIIYRIGPEYFNGWPVLPKRWLIFPAILASIGLLWFIKLMAIKLTGIIFRTKQDTSELILTNLVFNGVTGIVIFPFVVTGFYTGNLIFIKIAGVILLTGMALRFFRSLLIGLSAQTFSVIYLFLYLCTLEILPLLFLYRFSLVIN